MSSSAINKPPLTNLICGDPQPSKNSSDYSHAMNAISLSIEANESEIYKYWDNWNDIDTRIAASCARVLLEQGMAVILGRIDPIRLVTIVKGSKSTDFKIGELNKSSFIWSQDVIANINQTTREGLWTQKIIGDKIYRSILNGHIGDYLFSSAHKKVIESISDYSNGNQPLSDFIIDLQKIDIEKSHVALTKTAALATRAYSTLSKAIHFEFFLGTNTKPEKNQIRTATIDAISALATTALYTHFSDASLRNTDETNALNLFFEVTNRIY